MIIGNEILCYRNKGDKDPRIMHSLGGTFIEARKPEVRSLDGYQDEFYPIKIVIPPSKSRILFFKTKALQKEWVE